MIRAEGFLSDSRRALVERLGPRTLALGAVQQARSFSITPPYYFLQQFLNIRKAASRRIGVKIMTTVQKAELCIIFSIFSPPFPDGGTISHCLLGDSCDISDDIAQVTK
jgi:hypothetical protein